MPIALDHLFRIPQIAIRIAEGHRDVGHCIDSGLVRLLLHLLQHVQVFFQRLVLIVLQECRRERIRKADGAHRFGRDSALDPALVDHNADDLDIIRRIEFAQDGFRVGHLRHRLGRDERDRVNVLESRGDQRLQVLHLDGSRNLSRQALPGIAGTFDEGDLSH